MGIRQLSMLPFPRGSTASNLNSMIDGNTGLVSILPTATGTVTGATPFRKDLATTTYDIRDQSSNSGSVTLSSTPTKTGTVVTPPSLIGGGGGSNPVTYITMRAVQAAVTFQVKCVGMLIPFGTTAGEYGSVSGASGGGATACLTTSTGQCTKPIDNCIPVGTVIYQYDWFLVHEEGAAIVTVANGQTVSQQAAVTCYSTAAQVGPAGAGNTVLGTSEQTLTGSTSGSLALIYVRGGIQASEP